MWAIEIFIHFFILSFLFQLLDCFTIPVVLLLSFFLLRVRYLILHVVGVLICLIGVAFVVSGDIESGKAAFDSGLLRFFGSAKVNQSVPHRSTF